MKLVKFGKNRNKKYKMLFYFISFYKHLVLGVYSGVESIDNTFVVTTLLGKKIC